MRTNPVVGQIPPLDLYQLLVPATTMSELDSLIATLSGSPMVESVVYNVVAHDDDCTDVRDVGLLSSNDRCPWEATRYLQASKVLDELASADSLSPVQVGIVDSGLQSDNGEFDDVLLSDVHRRHGLANDLYDFRGHGTAVASIIAADNDARGIDGIASVLGRRLNLLVARVDRSTFAVIAPAILRAIAAGAKVINLSLSYDPSVAGLSTIRAHFDQLIRNHPEVLFVASAGNRDVEITGANLAPGGLSRPNLITVGSSSACSPEMRFPESGWGARVDIAAQGDTVPIIEVSGRLGYLTGTSFSNPQVTAAAALLLSVEPTLSPNEVRDYILDNALPGPATTNGRFLNIARSLNQLVVDQADPDWSTLLDGDGDGSADGAGLVATRICSSSDYRLEGVGSFRYPKQDVAEDEIIALGTILEDAMVMNLRRPGSDTLTLACEACPFDLDIFRAAGNFVTPPEPMTMPVVGQVSGEVDADWFFDRCVIEDRYPDIEVPDTGDFPNPGDPKNVRVTSVASGLYRGSRVDGYDRDGNPILSERSGTFEGGFSILFVSGITTPGHPVVRALETQCENGRFH